MYDMIKDIIDTGGFNLTDMILKIDRSWYEGQIDATERDALKEYARSKASPDSSYATDSQRILDLETALRALEARVAALEEAGGDTPTPDPQDIPDWVQPTGAYNAYNIGDKVRYNGHIYESIISGNVWAPDVYPAGWKEITE